MKKDNSAPKARRSELVIKELATETLVYDESNNKAHCLNQTAAFIWKHCDGRNSIPTLARLVEKEINADVSEQTVWFALKQLEESRLLEGSPSRPTWLPEISRRELVRSLGIAAVALPIVTSIVAPTAASAATIPACQPLGAFCGPIGQQGTCCPGLICNPAALCGTPPPP